MRNTSRTNGQAGLCSQKVDPALIALLWVGCFWPIFFFTDHSGRVGQRIVCAVGEDVVVGNLKNREARPLVETAPNPRVPDLQRALAEPLVLRLGINDLEAVVGGENAAKLLNLTLSSKGRFTCALLFIHPRAPNLISLRSAGTMSA